MRLISTKSAKPGTILAQTIYNDNGQVLIKKGLLLTEKMLNRLLNQGITYIYIEDDLTGDIKIESALSEKLRKEATHAIKDIFFEIKNTGLYDRSYLLEKKGNQLTSVIERIINEIVENEESLSLLADIFVTDDYIFQHSLNVTIYSLAIGTEMQLSHKELSEIGLGAMLHDIGKIFLDQEILKKPNKLSDEEFEIVKSHTQLGFDFLRKNTNTPLVIAHCAYQHHERLDGSGYPRGLAGNAIHKYAKLISIADVFDAVTSNRVYRDAMLPHEGLEILYAGAVNLFEKEMVQAFKKSVAVYPKGLTVGLSDNREGIVVRQNKGLCDRPVIRIISENNNMVTEPYECDLSKAVNVMITSCHID
ncbi:HD-GYP domain-containing protein [Virgibacillus oceani]|uniref:Phosphodiesterase n=1 Tax=Virgibacillus oceani TaxID=1479511 RepID=A0A917H3J4_9BACI|nr:HD-GYP domain-containing protein [Virgibacillus oceani]GGG66464.1 phosphodiesterase [Virgibacillus oceani]